MTAAIGTPENCEMKTPLGAITTFSGREAVYMGEDVGWQFFRGRDITYATITNSGMLFWPLDPHPCEIHLEDIAHGLAGENRFGKQSDYPYSVAWHSVALSHLVPPHLKQWALMHDAAEAYLGDLTRPIKRHPKFGFIEEVEKTLLTMIVKKIGLDPITMPEELKKYDTFMGNTEMWYGSKAGPAKMTALSHITEINTVIKHEWKDWIKPVPFEEAKEAFLTRYYQLFR